MTETGFMDDNVRTSVVVQSPQPYATDGLVKTVVASKVQDSVEQRITGPRMSN